MIHTSVTPASVSASQSGINVYAPAAFAQIFDVLAERFRAEHAVDITLTLAPVAGASPDSLANRLARGERPHVLIAPLDVLERLTREGALPASERRAFMRSSIAMGVRAGAPKPDLSSLAAFKRALEDASCVALSAAGSGIHLKDHVFPSLGLADLMAAKSKVATHEPAGALVARGEADLAFQQLSELMSVAGLDIVGLLPEEAQKHTVLAAQACSNPANDAAIAWMALLAGDEASRVYREAGTAPA